MRTIEITFRKPDDKITLVQDDDITVVSKDGATDGVAVLLKVAGNSTNSLVFDSDFESLDGSTFDNTKMNHIYMVYDVDGNGTVPKTFYTVKTTSL